MTTTATTSMFLGRAAAAAMPPSPLLLVLLLGLLAAAQEPSCCSLASGSCRSACVQVSLVSLATEASDNEGPLTDVIRFCPSEMEEFWQCFNQTLQEVAGGAGWAGRLCCPQAQALACRRACATAASRNALRPACRVSDELPFFACIDRQETGTECCANARTAECASACRAVFRAPQTPTREQRSAVLAACADASPRVIPCVKDVTKVTPPINSHKHLRCCDKTSVPECRDTCRRILRSHFTSSQEMVDALEGAGCGPPLPHDSLWQCFLQTAETSRIDRLGMDSAKLHCCAKANRDACRRLCVKTYSNEWTRSWEEFHTTCLTQLSEDALVHCIDEVEEPCELGCDGLGFCTNFNNRPTELFRSCGRMADDAARLQIAQWSREGAIVLANGLSLPLRNVSACMPRHWRAVACSQQLRPCHPHTHTNRICSEDCYDLVNQCVDWGRIAGGGKGTLSPAAVCSQLSPDNPRTPCVSLAPYLEPSPRRYWPPQDGLLQPCRGEPCNGSQACLVNRHCAPGRPCLPYKCVPGCKLGEVSQYVVPQGTYVRLLTGSSAKDCPKVCQCGANGAIENCQPLSCVYFDPCHLSDHQKIAHNSWFFLECNICTCYAGDVTCSKRQCEEAVDGPEPAAVAFAGLPCRCPPHHVPVCGRNGNNYPSSCLARCGGLTDMEFEFGACSSRDPCTQAQCPTGYRCVPARRVCLSVKYRTCPQHECVDITTLCSSQGSDPVCDTDGEEHLNLCYLLTSGKTLAYRGPCLEGCEREGEVCGADGNTYPSECAAAAARAPLDYRGPCVAVGFVSVVALPQCAAAGVRCPPLPDDGDGPCEGLTPPGACCPVCAGALRLLYSQKQVDRVLYGTKGGALSALTVRAVLAALERQVQVAECSVRGYLTVELELLALVVAAGRGGRPASPLQREACVREAEKLAGLVQRASPRVLSELSLSMLTTASVAHAVVPSAAPAPASSSTLWLLATLTLAAAAARL